jgi:glucose-6-phosphate isomerase
MHVDLSISPPLDSDELRVYLDTLDTYRAHLDGVVKKNDYSAPEASLLLPGDAGIRQAVAHARQWAWRDNLRYVIVIGIGGSNLGAQAVADALDVRGNAELLFLDTTSSATMERCMRTLEVLVNKDEFIINVISKSGTTTETIANFEILYAHLTKRFGNIADRVVATTDEGSALWGKAQKSGFYALAIPANVGGRYSVLSSVGLLPLALSGIQTDELLRGAEDARNAALQDGIENNETMLMAAMNECMYARGYVTHNMFVFDPRLESLGKWWRQLVGESLGKSHDMKGKEVTRGIVPLVSVGSVDLHSVGQLFLSGAQNIFTTFVSVDDPGREVVAPTAVTELGKRLAGKSLNDVLDAIKEGTIRAYKTKKLPHAHVALAAPSAYEVGVFLQDKMLEVMFTAKLWNVNAFDQPNVEDYKKETRKLLK